MTPAKYNKYFIKKPIITRGGFFPVLVANGAQHFDGAEFSLRMHYITETGILVKKPHSHSFEQFYFFIGADFSNIKEFKAVVEFSLGRECEKHIIDVPTAVHVPTGMIHGPMNFKRIDKPIIFIDTLLSAQYATK